MSVFTLIALIFSTIAIFFVYLNIPIVTVEPFVIQVEPKSGITQVVNSQSAREIAASEAINTYFIVRYIKSRETVDSALKYHHEVVRLMSAPYVYAPYAWEVSPNNPDSFMARSGGQGVRDVKIRSMARTDRNPTCIDKLCQVQIRITIYENGKQHQSVQHQIIYMDYTFTNVNLTQYERYVNPIGFRVVSYRKTDEVLQ